MQFLVRKFRLNLKILPFVALLFAGHLAAQPVLAPTTQATDVTFTPGASTAATISWTNGSGQRRMVFMKEATTGEPAPVDLTAYSPNTVFGAGAQVEASGWYAVAAGTGTSVTVSGLTQNTAYRVMVVEYNSNGIPAAAVYQTATASGNPLNFTTPLPVGITSLARADANPTNAATARYTLTLDDAITAGMTASRFSLSTTGISGASIASVTGSGDSYIVTVSTGTGSGNLTLDLDTATNINPGISTALPYAGETYRIDRTAPELTMVTLASNHASPSLAYAGDVVTLSFTASEPIDTPTVTIAGHAVVAANTSGDDWEARYTMSAGDVTGLVTFAVAFIDSAGNTGTAVTATSNAGTVSFTAPPPPPPPVYGGTNSGVDLVGPLEIASGAVISGGRLAGPIDNFGLITGVVTLGPGTTIYGGTVSGVIRGNPASPAWFYGVSVTANTRLEHIIIGPGTVLSPDAVIGAGVSFQSNALIPPGLDLTGALSPFRWSGGNALNVVNLGGDVLRVAARDILESMRLLPGQPLDLQQRPDGELVVGEDSARGMLLPVRVRQAPAGRAAGIYVDGNGNLLVITAEGREVLVYPVLLADGYFGTALAESSMSFAYDELSRLNVLSPQSDSYHVGRAALAAIPAFRNTEPGLQSYVVSAPANVQGYSLIFEDTDGTLMEQELVPTPVDWPLLSASLLAYPSVSAISIGVDGEIEAVVDGGVLRGRTAFLVHRAEAGGGTSWPPRVGLYYVGDLNGDGFGDYEMYYPGGQVQALYVYP